jgi:hypothetical protein
MSASIADTVDPPHPARLAHLHFCTKAGANLVETAAILGHSGLMEVLTYGHLVDTRREEIAAKDAALLGVQLDREAGSSEAKWGEAAFYHPWTGGGRQTRHRAFPSVKTTLMTLVSVGTQAVFR